MLCNLEAEQARKNKTDSAIAQLLNVSRETYCKKKKNLSFKLKEILILCDYFGCDFNYLFATDEQSA